jgi:hypothetical protein
VFCSIAGMRSPSVHLSYHAEGAAASKMAQYLISLIYKIPSDGKWLKKGNCIQDGAIRAFLPQMLYFVQ